MIESRYVASMVDLMMIVARALSDEYVYCIENELNYREKFGKSYMYVCFPEKEEQEDKDE